MSTQVLSNTSLEALGELLRSRGSFVLSAHIRPDGDAIGSVLGLGLALQAAGKEVRMLSEDPVPGSLAFLAGAGKIEVAGALKGPVKADVAIALDTATQVRLGDGVNAAFQDSGAATLVNIDHHVSNPRYGDFHFIDVGSPATGQIVYQLLKAAGFPLDRAIAEALYSAISTDTGSFQYSNTTAETYRIAAELVELGVPVGDLNCALYQSFPLRRTLLLGELLGGMKITAGGRCASGHITDGMRTRAGAVMEDSENLIDHLRAIEGVVVAAFFEEGPEGKIRVSLRSKDPRVDVSALCAHFGGGGHKMAAGARVRGPIGEAMERVLAKIHEALESL